VLDPARYTPFFSYGGGHLACERVPLELIAARDGTPAYVYSRSSIEAAYRLLDRSLGALPHTVCYSVKANSNLEILRVLARLGSGFDIVSGGELYRLGQIGVPGRRIVFSGVGKTREEIREALRYGGTGILLFNVESTAEL
jgi:diaminopimelate decarboxylase